MEYQKKLFPPNGRLSQRDYILWQLLIFVASIGLLIFVFTPVPGLFFLIIGLSIFELYISAKRLQDCNLSGWYSLLLLIPAINGIGVLFLCLYPGTKGKNKFGENPKDKDNNNIKTNDEFQEDIN